MNNFMQDLRFAVRGFGKNPGFMLAAVSSLAIGIGANTALFSVINALLLRPLPYRDSDRLVILWNRSPGLNITQDWFSTAQYFDVKNGHSGFEEVAIAIGGNENLTGGGEPERVDTIHVSSNLLPMIGARAATGRLFTSAEDVKGAPLTAVLSYGIWTRRYGSDPHILGKSIIVNGKSYEVVGILPRAFSLPYEVLPTLGGAEQAEILLPLPMEDGASTNRDHEDYNIIGKLKRGVSVQQAQAEMDTLTARLRRDHPDLYPPNGGLTFAIVPLLEQVVGDVRQPLLLLLGAVGFVLLIACANVANLLLSRAVARQQEIAVRAALGASRRRLLYQLITESITLALCGAVLGVLFAFGAIHQIQRLEPKGLPRLHDIRVDGFVLLFTLLLSVTAGLLFGIAPALRMSRLSLRDTLQDASRGSSGMNSVWGRGNNLRKMLVVSEVALSLVLLIGSGLLIRSFARLQNVPPGFNPNHVLTLGLTMAGRQYDSREKVLNAYRQLWPSLTSIPGVTSAGGITSLPLSQMYAWGPITIEGRIPPPGENFINADQRIVGGEYFEAMQIPLLRGRLFTDDDKKGSPPVTLIDEYMAQEFWPNQDAVGRRIRLGNASSNDPSVTVVGIVGRVKQYSLDSDSRIALYLPHQQYPTREMNVVLRCTTDAGSLSSAVKAKIRGLDPDLPVYSVRTMTSRVEESLARRRFSMLLLVLFGAVSMLLAAIGVYGVMAYLVNQGTREIGIRMALGATNKNILQLVLRRGMGVTFAGITIGFVVATGVARLLASMLFGIHTLDWPTFAAATALLASVALVANLTPALRAARIDPMVCLRHE